jgi:replicative DNA helicase
VFIDYLGLINSDNKNGAYEKYSDISRKLKITAMECDKPIIALHQLNRAGADRKDKRPKLSDIRDSGKIEQDADSVLFVFRPYYYERNPKNKDLFQIIIPKNRHGKTGTANLLYNASTQEIKDRIEIDNEF